MIHPKMTVMDATTQVWRQLDTDYKKTHILHEIILEEGLERPMDHNELLMDCILKWSDWPEEDRKHSHLILKAIKDEFGESLKSVGSKSSTIFKCEANYSPNTGRRIDKAIRDKAIRRVKTNYIKCHIEIKGDSITCSKKSANRSIWTLSNTDSAAIEGLHRKSLSLMSLASPSALLSPPAEEPDSVFEMLTLWRSNEIFWYYGTELKRHSPTEFNITFIKRSSKVTRSRSHPYFGESISFEKRKTWINFVAALLQSKSNQERGPPPGIPLSKKPLRLAPSVISDIEEYSSEEEEEEDIEFRDAFAKDSIDSGDRQSDSVKLNIGRLVGAMSLGASEKSSLQELLTSLSSEKEHIEKRVSSGSYVEPYTRKHIERSSSFS